MSSIAPSVERDWRRWIVALEIAIVAIWGGGFLVVANALSGPFPLDRWIVMASLWLGLPLLITGALVLIGYVLMRAGRRRAGTRVLIMPLVLAGMLAIWAVLFG